MRKLISFIVSLVIVILIYIISIHIPKSYAYIYKVGNFSVVEKYNKQGKYYSFEIGSDNKNEYVYSVKGNYHRKRGIINKVSLKDNCLIGKSDYLDTFYVCKEEDLYITKFYNQEINDTVIDNYENIDIYAKLDNNFLIWNYSGFVYNNKQKFKNIKLFNKDVYELEIVTKLDNYLVIADYNQKYYFDKLYIIDSKNGKLKESKLNRKVYFDSYILGTYKKNIYLFDNNKEVEYSINPFKNTIEKNAYEILNNGKWEKVSINKLKKQEIKFVNNEDYEFQLIDGLLYYKTPVNKILVTNLEVSKIVDSNDKEAYFISNDSMYHVDIDKKITKLFRYSEWIFNNQNIYIF